MEGFSYEEELNRLGLYSLEFRRMRGHLRKTYRILRGLDRVDAERLHPLWESLESEGIILE